jgi:hypothetical protein
MNPFLILRTLVMLLLAASIALPLSMRPAAAATQNFIPDVDVDVLSFHLTGQYTATVNPAAKFKLPYPARIIGVTATARASGGTSPTLTVDLEDDGTSVLSSAISVTAGTVAEGTIANAAVADESVMEIVLTIGGTSPTWDDITVLITVVRT